MRVHDTLGPGLLESVYEEAICYELKKEGLSFKRQYDIPVKYGDIELGIGFRADLIVEDKVIVELKSVEEVSPVHSKTLLTYMRLTGIEVGLIINFNTLLLKNGITRLIDDKSKFAKSRGENKGMSHGGTENAEGKAK